ncbi:hypothetical protein A8C32_02455 [Flavivirga aquatica]|uniref:Ig-like domain-containing protein n=1 Tax=Flavivirga aquatica TaxID=1849968 RepID=A0A1E5TAC9_9FLAO|nr:gliding motility-associated C-terminal domain-containing protein [Flavivirga aquatica]OEK08333.1 hypothetical protein A8C32_02455 [Flavivirga aquatica]
MRKFTVICIAAFVFISLTGSMNAQIVIDRPVMETVNVCASEIFNSYKVEFGITPSDFNANNQFIIELSDASGSFATPTTIYTSKEGEFTEEDVVLYFSVPKTIGGVAYKIRVKSTSPAVFSQNSRAFSAYFKIHDEPFTINNFISTAVYCAGGSYVLTIDESGPDNNSPLDYPGLTYNWYREITLTTSDFISTGETLTVNEPGTYFVETNYGSCTSRSLSKSTRVTVSEATTATVSSINSSLGNPFCLGDGSTTLSTTAGDTYQWFKDGTPISGATNQTHVTNESGVYSVNINFGGCSASATIDLNSNEFTSSIDVDTSEPNIVEAGESLIATVITTANSPEYEWYLNGSIISGATNNSFEATEEGNYKAVVTQTVGCISSSEFIFEITEAIDPFPDVANIPNLISPNNDGVNDTWVIPKEYISGTNTEIMILTPQGEIVFQTNDYQNNWPEDLDFKEINPVYYYIIMPQDQKIKKGTITIIK